METPKKPLVPKQEESVGSSFRSFLNAVRGWLHQMFDLQEGLDREGAIISIKNNKHMRGANAWMLGCSIMIASLGLDLNSPAVIIGAMLVSPLMSPILGIGLGVAINDKDTLFGSLRHFGLAIFIALVTSTFYFFVTPFGQVTSEIQSRTSPTFLDGLVAVFGGLAGIISATRRDKSNAIPGVAIATALMPPLCVTGFGIAEMMELLISGESLSTLEFRRSMNNVLGIIGGSFYLFFLNSFFIALTAYSIIKLLRFPLRSYVNEREARRNRIITVVFSIIIILPSAWILFQLYTLQQDKQLVSKFVKDHFPETCINYELDAISRDTNKLIIQLLGSRIPEDSISHYEEVLTSEYELSKPVRLFPIQAELSMQGLNNLLTKQRQEVVSMLETERKRAELIAQEQEQLIREAQRMQSDSVRLIRGVRLAREAFPNKILSVSYAEGLNHWQDSSNVQEPPAFIVGWKKGTDSPANIKQLRSILELGIEIKDFQIISYISQ